MTIAAQHHDATAATDTPCSVKDLSTLVEISGPGVVGAKAPVLGEWDAADDEFPLDSIGVVVVAFEPVKKVLQLLFTKHGLAGSIECYVGGAVPPGVEHEERRGGPPGKGVVCLIVAGTYRRRVRRVLVVGERLDGRAVDAGGVGGPVVSNFVVVEDVQPREVGGHGGPVRRGVDLTVVLAVVFDGNARAAGNVDVNEVAEEEHERCF